MGHMKTCRKFPGRILSIMTILKTALRTIPVTQQTLHVLKIPLAFQGLQFT